MSKCSWIAVVAVLPFSLIPTASQAESKQVCTVNSGIAGNSPVGLRCIEPLNGSGEAGTPIVVSDDQGSSTFLWQIEGREIRWTMSTQAAPRCLGTDNGASADGTRLVLAVCDPTAASQRWTVTNQGLVSGIEGKCLAFTTAIGVSNNVANSVVLKPCSDANYGQVWNIP